MDRVSICLRHGTSRDHKMVTAPLPPLPTTKPEKAGAKTPQKAVVPPSKPRSTEQSSFSFSWVTSSSAFSFPSSSRNILIILGQFFGSAKKLWTNSGTLLSHLHALQINSREWCWGIYSKIIIKQLEINTPLQYRRRQCNTFKTRRWDCMIWEFCFTKIRGNTKLPPKPLVIPSTYNQIFSTKLI